MSAPAAARPVRVSTRGAAPAEGRDIAREEGTLRLLGPGRGVLRLAPGSPEVPVLVTPLDPPDAPASRDRATIEVVVEGWRFELEVEDAAHATLRDRASRERGGKGHGGATQLRAIIPGRIVAVAVAPGDTVVPGQQLLVIEAMKMQNELRAPRAGVIARVVVGPGQTVDLGDLLVEIG
jgi:biotin carboxyl carrier protein